MTRSLCLYTNNPEETQEVGRSLGFGASSGDIFLLVGDLGAGKTCLTQGIAWGLGVHEYARSPSFVLVTQYQGRLTLYHADLYRLDTVGEILDLGLEEYLCGAGVSVVEWADKAPEVFPQDHLVIRIESTGDTSRELSFFSESRRYCEFLAVLQKDLAAFLSPGRGSGTEV